MPPPAISAENVVKCFGDIEALKGVSLSVPEGSVLGLLGPNGAGKTTMVRVLTTLLRPDSGAAQVLGHDVHTHAAQVRGLIGLAGQYAAVDENLTGAENLRLVGRLTHLDSHKIRERTTRLLEEFDLAHAADRLVRTFSGGMRRRLDLAAALVHEPPVLFLDEPTTGLDPQGRADLWEVIGHLVGGGTTVLLTTQYLEEADRFARNIVVIDHGAVIAEGTSAELKSRFGDTVIEVAFANESDLAAAAEQLKAVGEVSRDGNQLNVCVADGAGAMLNAVRTLDAASLEPTTMTLREPTLDDVFLSLTGHKAEDPSPDGNAASRERVEEHA